MSFAFGKRAVLSGAAIAMAVMWVLLQMGEPGSAKTLSLPWPVLMLLSAAGFLAAHLAARFTVRKLAMALRAVLLAVLCAEGVAARWLTSFGSLDGLVAFALFAALFFVAYPLVEDISDNPSVFLVAVVFLPLLAALWRVVLSGLLPEDWLQPLLAACLSVACAMLAWRAAALRGAETVPEPTKLGLSLPVTVAVCLLSWLSVVSVSTDLPVRVASPGAGAGRIPGLPWLTVCLLFFAAAALVYAALLKNGRIWQALYAAFTSYCLGELLLFLSKTLESSVLQALPVMLFVTAAAGMTMLFFTCLLQIPSRLNRVIACGAALILALGALLLPLAETFTTWLSALPGYPYFSATLLACMLLLGPAFFRTHAAPAPVEAPEASVAALPSAADEPAGDEAAPMAQMLQNLTNAEKRVFLLILNGYSNQQIANELFISINTVKFHIRNVLAKTGVQKKRDLIACYLSGKQPPLQNGETSG